MWAVLLGAFLVICGMLYIVREAVARRRLSDPSGSPASAPAPTLEPRGPGVRFLGLGRNWPGMALIAIGALLLFFGGGSGP